MTPDLQRLRDKQSELASILERLELELVDDPAWGEPSDTSYLSAADRANPDIMANVAAMAATNKLVSWFGRDMEGFVGLWRGADDRPLVQAPVLRLDTEGQYSIVAATIPDYIAISVPEDEFAAAREALARAGFQVSMNADAIWGALDGFDDPNEHRNDLYEREREERGLAHFEEELEEPAPVPVPVPVPEKAVAVQAVPAKKQAAAPKKPGANKQAAAKPAKKAAAKKLAAAKKPAAKKPAAKKPAAKKPAAKKKRK